MAQLWGGRFTKEDGSDWYTILMHPFPLTKNFTVRISREALPM